MNVRPTALPEVLLVEPQVWRDGRGFFLETYREDRYREAGIVGPFVQDNLSRSTRGTLRGLHAQRRRPQGKLIQVTAGEVFDVAVDVRRGSPTFLRWVGVTLRADEHRQVWVPPGFAHGFCVLSDSADFAYKCTAPYDAGDEIRIAWDDPQIGVAWPVASPVLSAGDRAAPRVEAVLDLLPSWPGAVVS